MGQQVYQTNILVDGLDNSTRASGGELGYQMQVVRPSIDAVEEFEVVTNNNSAEYGGRMGATVVVETKSGTNQIHGSAYEFLRNGDLDATSFFSVGQPKPAYHQNQFGGTLGGPVIKNKLFFFGSAEAIRIDAGTTSLTTVPTSAERAGNFAGRAVIFDPTSTKAVSGGDTRTPFPGNQIPASMFDPIVSKVLALYPLPNLAGNVNNYYFRRRKQATRQSMTAAWTITSHRTSASLAVTATGISISSSPALCRCPRTAVCGKP